MAGALGKITGYGVGRSSRKLIDDSRIPAVAWRFVERNMTASIVVLSLVPNPVVDLVGVAAGRAGYSLGRFLALSTAGKVLQSFAFIYGSMLGIGILS